MFGLPEAGATTNRRSTKANPYQIQMFSKKEFKGKVTLLKNPKEICKRMYFQDLA
jgi:hypothetical protein